MDKIKKTGGARIGMANASWPFATLTVSKDKLQLNASILGNLVFKPTDIITIEPYNGLLSSGLKINHTVANYKSKVIFWTLGNAHNLIQEIERTGFLQNKESISEETLVGIESAQKKGGFPIKMWFAISVVIVWNLLILSDFMQFRGQEVTIGTGSRMAVGFIFGLGLLLLISAPVRQLALKEGKTLSDIKTFVYFLLFISGILFFMQL